MDQSISKTKNLSINSEVLINYLRLTYLNLPVKFFLILHSTGYRFYGGKLKFDKWTTFYLHLSENELIIS